MADEEYDDTTGEVQSSWLPSWLTETPYWAISAVVHLVLLFIIGGIVLIQPGEGETEQRTVVRREFKPQPYDPTKKRDMKRKPEILNPEKEKPIVKLKPDKVTAKIPKGTDMNNLTNKNLLSTSVNDAMGVGGGAAGAYGNRWGKGSLVNEGGSEATEMAVLAALYWLMRHQHPDGHWSSTDYYKEDPSEGYKLIKYPDNGYTDGRGVPGYDVGVTALAMLAYLGFGHTHQKGEYPEFVEVMSKATKWMLKQQSKSADANLKGSIGKTDTEEWIYNHAIATMALAELLVLSEDRFLLAKPVEEATEFCLYAQNEGRGWKYEPKEGKNDTSVTGWMVLALKTAKVASQMRLIKIEDARYAPAFEGALTWFNFATGTASGKTGYEGPGDPGSSLKKPYPTPYPYSKDLSCMTAVAVLCRLFAGESRRSDAIKKGVNILMAELPDWRPARGKTLSKINMYYWYYATFAMFQHGGSAWKEWNDAMQEALLPTQIQGGDEDGSWDPIGEWGAAGGRVYSTAINAMTLEVYYRFERQEGGS